VNSAFLLVPLLLVAGCGGGSTPASPEKKAYIARAEAICAKANADTKALTNPQAASDLAPYVAKVVVIADAALKAIDGLTPPAADKPALDKHVFTPLAAQVIEAHAYAAKVAAADKVHDEAALTHLTLNAPTGSKADLKWMRSYGFSACVDAANVGG
jgi:hypothetical protein